MISIETLKLFASKDDTRHCITLPRLVDGLVVATDRRILVEVPEGEVDPAGLAALEVLDCNFPAYRCVIDPPFSSPLRPLEMPPVPEKIEKKVTCPDCKGAARFKEFGEWEDCFGCDGRGEWMDDSEWRIETPAGPVAARFVDRANALPGLKWFYPGGDHEIDPVRFTFGVGGRGVLMRLRVAEGVKILKTKGDAE